MACFNLAEHGVNAPRLAAQRLFDAALLEPPPAMSQPVVNEGLLFGHPLTGDPRADKLAASPGQPLPTPFMILGEPPPTQGDIRFRLFGFPIRIHPFFWFVTLLMVVGGKEKIDPGEAVAWVGIVFVSILVHELGHAVMQKYYGGRPWITLYGLGGLASCDDCDRSPRSQIIISLAGPIAGFLLAALVIGVLNATGHVAGIAFSESRRPPETYPISLFLVTAYFEPLSSRIQMFVVRQLLWVNIAWGLVNLLPIYPLDGGRISRELFTLSRPRQGIVQSLQLSMGAAILMALYGALKWNSLFVPLMFGYLAYMSYQALQAYRGRYY